MLEGWLNVEGGAGATELQQSLGGRPPAQSAMPQVDLLQNLPRVDLQNLLISEP